MADDQTNPYTMMGMMGMMMPNPYTQYKGALPMPGYYGTPTDASGKSIQSFTDTQAQHDAWDQAHPQGTTLNSVPQSSGSGNPQMDQIAGWQALTNPEMAARGNTYGDPYLNEITKPAGSSSMAGSNPMTNSILQGAYNGQFGSAPGGAAGGAGGAGGGSSGGGTNPFDMRQAYLTALSDPQGGKPMPVPGATVSQSQPLGSPSVMNAFLAAHPDGGGTTGSYSNKSFFDTLGKLRSA